jgi:hypothetical protein
MCYGENGTVKFLETLPDNVFKHSYSVMQIKKKKMVKFWGYPGLRTPLISTVQQVLTMLR